MKYDLVTMIQSNLSKKELLSEGKIMLINDIVNSDFPELNGLKLKSGSIITVSDDSKTILIPLINSYGDEISLKLYDEDKPMRGSDNREYVEISNPNRKFNMKMVYCKKKIFVDDNIVDLCDLSFTSGEDILTVHYNFENEYPDEYGQFCLYRDGVRVSDEDRPYMIPDYSCSIQRPWTTIELPIKKSIEGPYVVNSNILEDTEENTPRIGIDRIVMRDRTKTNTMASIYRYLATSISEEYKKKYLDHHFKK